MTLKGIVIAGNPDQYLRWLNENKLNRNEFIYVDSFEKIRGLQNLSIYLVGECWKNPINDIDTLRYLKSHGNEIKRIGRE